MSWFKKNNWTKVGQMRFTTGHTSLLFRKEWDENGIAYFFEDGQDRKIDIPGYDKNEVKKIIGFMCQDPNVYDWYVLKAPKEVFLKK